MYATDRGLSGETATNKKISVKLRTRGRPIYVIEKSKFYHYEEKKINTPNERKKGGS